MFVDVHSHVVPSGDDGAQSLQEGLALCQDAAEHGTRLLFATPHVWPHLRLTTERERALRAVQSELREASPLELRLGFEVTPFRELLHEDLGRYALEGVDAVLFDTPFIGPLDLLFALAERAREQGLRPIAAHPERAEAVLLDSTLLDELAQRALLIQVNASSLTGRHGPEIEDVGWRALERGLADLVASDGHGPTRPARLDDAFEAARRRVGEGAVRLFDGSALALRSEPVRPAEASHAA